jgi:dihydroneopterin aldolase/D-erythro-7,8-dihydroneopterin triphosphate epimerase
MPLDKIIIRDLTARCTLGITSEERRGKQEIVINLVLLTDVSAPGRTDRIEDAVDYRAIKKNVLAFVEQSEFALVEALAEHVVALCLQHPSIEEVQVTIDKPAALRFARSVAVEITRRRA